MTKFIVTLFSMLASTAAVPAEETDHAIHEELRTLLHGMQQAINAERYSELEPYFHENLRVTTINQEVISERAEITDYFERWFGDGGYLASLEISLTADDTTELYGDKSFGIVRGTGGEKYVLSDGRAFDMSTRWTATVIKDTDGQWRILALHIGTNFLDNPILSVAESALKTFTAAGALAGLVLGWLITFFYMRRRKAPA
jgi:ketosteroid isomerase-like protein